MEENIKKLLPYAVGLALIIACGIFVKKISTKTSNTAPKTNHPDTTNSESEQRKDDESYINTNDDNSDLL